MRTGEKPASLFSGTATNYWLIP